MQTIMCQGGHSDSGVAASHILCRVSSSSSCCSNTTGSSSRRHRFTCCCQRVLVSLLPPVSRPPDTSRLVYLGCTSWFACRTDRITSDRWISGAQQTKSIIILSERWLMEGMNKGSGSAP